MRRTLLVLSALGSLAAAGGQARARTPWPGAAAGMQLVVPVQWDARGDRDWSRDERRHEEWRAREEERRREEWHHRRWLCEHRGICG